MSELNQNYTEKKGKKKRILIALIFLLCSCLLFVGIVSAFFTDIVSQPGNLTAGTLKLNVDYDYYLNGDETALDNIVNLNPGDVVVVKGRVSNIGNKSAWVRDELLFDSQELLPYLQIYDGEFSQETILDVEEDLSDYLISPTGNSIVSAVKVIDGSGIGAETEGGEGYDYVGDSYTVTFTVYFMHSAGNQAQGKVLGFTLSAKAIQFRNNKTVVPDDAAWAAVLAA